MIRCYEALSHSTADRRFVFGLMVSNQSRSIWALDSGKRAFCRLSFSLFTWIWINKYGQADECATIGNCKISTLLFADNLVLLSSTESGLHRALNSFADACNTAAMKISTKKIEVLQVSRNPDECVLQVNGAILKQVEKFKYLGVAFTSNGRQEEELNSQTGEAGAVM